jgi:multidrug efflux system outer membrane protein
LSGLTLGLLLASCSISPKYTRPEPLPFQGVPNSFANARSTGRGQTNQTEWKIAETSASLPSEAWWELFADPELTRLETLASRQNQELAAAAARLQQARAMVSVARADLFPHLSAQPGLNRQRTSFNSFDRGGPAGISHTYNNFTIPLDAEWEFDLWGRVRQQVSAAHSRLAASEDDVRAARLSIGAEVAANYFSLEAFNAEFRLVEQTIGAFRRSLELTRNRRRGGIASELDVSQAETQLKSAEALLPAIELNRTRIVNALAMLCAQSASGFEVHPPERIARVPEIKAGYPSELLERRPDIAAAERRMAAANADVGVAQTAFYPRVLFHGLAGFQSIDAGSLFNWPSRVWALGPSIELPIFTGGRNRAELAFARAGYAGTVADYRQTVLTAFQEVEDQLAAQRLLAEQFASEKAALTSAQRTLEIAQNRYKAGLVTYLEVATAQSAALDRERSLVRLNSERLTAQVALVKALGGGWRGSPLAMSR